MDLVIRRDPGAPLGGRPGPIRYDHVSIGPNQNVHIVITERVDVVCNSEVTPLFVTLVVASVGPEHVDD